MKTVRVQVKISNRVVYEVKLINVELTIACGHERVIVDGITKPIIEAKDDGSRKIEIKGMLVNKNTEIRKI